MMMMLMIVMTEVKETLSQYIKVSNLKKKKHVNVTLLINKCDITLHTYGPSMWWLRE